MPHLGEESESRRRVGVVNRKFYMGLGKKTWSIISLHVSRIIASK